MPSMAITWAQRLKRVFDIDVETCSDCGGDIKIIASIEDPAVIRRILAHLDQNTSLHKTKYGKIRGQVLYFASQPPGKIISSQVLMWRALGNYRHKASILRVCSNLAVNQFNIFPTNAILFCQYHPLA